MNGGGDLSFRLTLEELEAFDPAPVRGGSEWRFRCPFCNSKERTFHLNRDSGLWNCKRASCDARGKLAGAGDQTAPFTRRQRAQAGLEQVFGSSPQRESPLQSRPGKPQGFEKEKTSASSNAEEAKVVWDRSISLRNTPGQFYLEKRGFSIDTVVASGARFSPSWSCFRRLAVVFPISDEKDVLWAAQGRFLEDCTPKAMTVGPVSQGVYASPGAWEAEIPVFTEAPLDAISLWYCGVPAFALCGVSERPWLWPRCLFKRVALAFDADEGGDKASANWRRDLAGFGASCVRIRPEGAKDWNEMLQKRGQTALNRYVNSVLSS